MSLLAQTMKNLISISDRELERFLAASVQKEFKKNEIISRPHNVPNEVFFVHKGLIRVFVYDNDANEHTVHFAMEGSFISDYTNFMLQQPSYYTLQALEKTEVSMLPRSLIEWGYANLHDGQKMGRLVAESYFIYHDERIRNQYIRTAKERYDSITKVFPNIHNRVPQHMIASYLGITPVHLSRLKKEDYTSKT